MLTLTTTVRAAADELRGDGPYELTQDAACAVADLLDGIASWMDDGHAEQHPDGTVRPDHRHGSGINPEWTRAVVAARLILGQTPEPPL